MYCWSIGLVSAFKTKHWLGGKGEGKIGKERGRRKDRKREEEGRRERKRGPLEACCTCWRVGEEVGGRRKERKIEGGREGEGRRESASRGLRRVIKIGADTLVLSFNFFVLKSQFFYFANIDEVSNGVANMHLILRKKMMMK